MNIEINLFTAACGTRPELGANMSTYTVTFEVNCDTIILANAIEDFKKSIDQHGGDNESTKIVDDKGDEISPEIFEETLVADLLEYFS